MADVTFAERVGAGAGQTNDKADGLQGTGQGINAALSGWLTSVSLSCRTAACTGGTIVVELYHDPLATNEPAGAVIATSDPQSTVPLISGTFSDIIFTFDGTVELTAGQSYFVRMIFEDDNGVGATALYEIGTNLYPGGNLATTENAGSTWSQSTTFDLIFGVYGTDEPPPEPEGGGGIVGVMFDIWGW
jgi:hypothetical protein